MVWVLAAETRGAAKAGAAGDVSEARIRVPLRAGENRKSATNSCLTYMNSWPFIFAESEILKQIKYFLPQGVSRELLDKLLANRRTTFRSPRG